ncbi:Cyclase family protein [[Clostridium] ultunense Esp]|nr:Cyclase family protein [[Clostridium] ultunense Esp]
MNYKLYDISQPIFEGMPVYKNKMEKQPRIEVVQDFPASSARESRLHLDAHTGTHVDAPLHMIPGGEDFGSISLQDLVGPCRVLDLTQAEDHIGKEDLLPHGIRRGEFLLLKTKNSETDSFRPDFIFLREDGAEYLAETGVRGIGIDALGIERSQPGHPTHKRLFRQGILIVEGLRLKEVPEGDYFMVIAPLHFLTTEAAPARALLLQFEPPVSGA